MIISRLKLKNWKNFKNIEIRLTERAFILGPNASGKSNLLDVFRFLRDLAKPEGGGLQKAVSERGGVPKLRCLAARRDPEILVEVDLANSSEDDSPIWTYTLAFKSEGKGRQRILVSKERVFNHRDGRIVLDRPNEVDLKDVERLTQTHLEQINTNSEFRIVADFFSSLTYLHLVPQLLRFPDQLSISRLEDDPFGQAFLERIADTPKKTRDARLKKIEDALKVCVPQMRDLKYEEERGRPHLQALYEHWRPDAGWQREDQFSDGTLRLLGIMWMLLDGNSTLLLEEPELSLNEEIVAKIPSLIWKMQRSAKYRRQIFITTHSRSMLDQVGISADEIICLEPGRDGTTVLPHSTAEVEMLKAGMYPSEVFLSKVNKSISIEQLDLFKS